MVKTILEEEKQMQTQQIETNGPLERLFGVANARILDFLSTFQDFDYSKQDIAKHSKVSFRHALRSIEQLEEKGLIKRTRNVGNSHMYKYNINNKAAILLDKFMTEMSLQECEKISNEEATQNQIKEKKQHTKQPITIEATH
jgi:DNA-binding MarR family transcriptional regulator